MWLATTLAKPPVDSIHVVWQKLGLATYLLCMLVKQHKGISDNLDQSVLSLQASPKRGSAVRRYYIKVGFISQNCAGDNGFSLTSHSFQNEVKEKNHDYLWIAPGKAPMSFFQLFQGCLNLPPEIIDVENIGEVDDGGWKAYRYAYFPWSAPSMRIMIEGYLDSRPIFRWLSGEPLPLTDRPLLEKNLTQLSPWTCCGSKVAKLELSYKLDFN